MHKLIAGLALSTLGLAVISIYLAIELRDARGKVESLSQNSVVAPMPLERATYPPNDAESTAPVAPMNNAAHSGTASFPNDDAKARQKVYEADYRDAARRQLAQLSDPTMR